MGQAHRVSSEIAAKEFLLGWCSAEKHLEAHRLLLRTDDITHGLEQGLFCRRRKNGRGQNNGRTRAGRDHGSRTLAVVGRRMLSFEQGHSRLEVRALPFRFRSSAGLFRSCRSNCTATWRSWGCNSEPTRGGRRTGGYCGGSHGSSGGCIHLRSMETCRSIIAKHYKRLIEWLVNLHVDRLGSGRGHVLVITWYLFIVVVFIVLFALAFHVRFSIVGCIRVFLVTIPVGVVIVVVVI
mmetsp:Transcript_9882/g.23410  ORF Transcript_9882/g.23410 Transcript_9882/m.23410 type:complete len:237 (-) Transcript_9882:74-784(-)